MRLLVIEDRVDRGHCHRDRDAGSEKEQQHLVRSTIDNSIAACCTAPINYINHENNDNWHSMELSRNFHAWMSLSP